MSDTDIVLIDMDPNDPFDFYLEYYKEQLVAGYTKETPSFGLRVYMRDFNKLHPKDSSIGTLVHRPTTKRKSVTVAITSILLSEAEDEPCDLV